MAGKTLPELPDEQLGRLAAVCRQNDLDVAFEVGGLRMGAAKPVRGQWGKAVAQNEFTHLKRWLEAGGTLDYLSTDHAVMMNLILQTWHPFPDRTGAETDPNTVPGIAHDVLAQLP